MADDATFSTAAAVVALLGVAVALVTPFAGSASTAFVGSMAASALVGLVFAGRNLQVVRSEGWPRLAPATVTTVFGLWFTVAPLLYDPGFLATAGTQLGGLLTASFAGYLAIDALDG